MYLNTWTKLYTHISNGFSKAPCHIKTTLQTQTQTFRLQKWRVWEIWKTTKNLYNLGNLSYNKLQKYFTNPFIFISKFSFTLIFQLPPSMHQNFKKLILHRSSTGTLIDSNENEFTILNAPETVKTSQILSLIYFPNVSFN